MTSPLQLDHDAPWRQRLRARRLLETYVAPAHPERGLVVCNLSSEAFQLYAWEVPQGELRQLSNEPGGVRYGWLTPDGEWAVFLRDDHGSELGHLAAIPYAGGPPQDLTPALPAYTLRGFDICRNGTRLAFDAVSAAGYQFYLIEIGPEGFGPPRLIYSSQQEAWEALLSYDGSLLALKSSARAGGRRRYSTIVLDTASGAQRAELWDGVEQSVEPVAFAPLSGDNRLALTTTRHGGVQRPVIWEPLANTRQDLALPEVAGEIAPLVWSPDGTELLLHTGQRAQERLDRYELASNTLHALAHPVGSFKGRIGPYHCGTSGAYYGPDGQVWALWSDAATPSQLLALVPNGSPQVRLALSDSPPGQPWRSVEFASSDGTMVQAWLGLPAGEGPFPTILNTHGGPHGHVVSLFSPTSQAWLDHGFAFLTVNYRGSTGFGRAFREQIDGDVGHWELEDMLAARSWLVEQGIARPDAVLLEGGSYGGYLTTWAMTQRPELWAGGIAPVALVDWKINYEDSSDALKGWARALLGGTPDELPGLYRERSPLTHIAQLRAPLIVVAGRHDSRTPPRQIETLAETMAELDKDLELVWLESGHGVSSGPALELMVERHLRFAYRVLGVDDK